MQGAANKPSISSVNGGGSVTVNNEFQYITVEGSSFQSGYGATFWGPSGTSFQMNAERLQRVDALNLKMYVGLAAGGTWKVRVTNPDGGVSNDFPFDVIETGRVSMPQFTPAQGTYSGSVSVTMTCVTSGATIRYTKDGNDPTASSPAYVVGAPLSIATTTTLKAKGFKTGSTSSGINTGLYVISSTGTLSPPTFYPSSGQSFSGSLQVYMYASPSTATIRYTTDGTEPTLSWGWTYNGNPVTIGSTTTMKARAYCSGYTQSAASTATYTFSQNAVSTPYFAPPPGNYAQQQSVSIYCDTPGVRIRYTLDSTDPTETYGLVYGGPISVTSTKTFRAKAFRTGWPASETAVGTYTITPPPPSTLQYDPKSISVTLSKLNPYTSMIVTLQNTGDKGIEAWTATGTVPWADWDDVQRQIPAYGAFQNHVSFYGYSLTPGTYHTTMRIQQSGYAPHEIPVTLTVQDYPAILECSTHSLAPTCTERDNTPSETFTLQNVGGGTLSYSLTQNVPWLSLEPASGSSAGEANTVQVNYSTTALTAGEHEGSITVTGNGVPSQTISVHLTVTPYGENVPVITNITPQKGSVLGGTRVIITGKNLAQTSAVNFAGTAATKLEDVHDTSLVATTPPYALFGKVDVEVVAPGGTTTRTNGFEYLVVRSNVIEEVAQIGGSASAVAAQGNYVYTNEGSTFVVFNVTTPSSPAQVARLRMAGMVTSIALSGNFAYVTLGDMGMAILDVTDPTNPVVRGYHAINGQAVSVCVFGGYAYVAVGSANKIFVFNILDPEKPEFVSSISVPGEPVQLTVTMQGAGLFAYVALYGAGIQIVDITDPTQPQLRGAFNAAECLGLSVKGAYVYLCLQSVNPEVVNVSNPDNPVLAAKMSGVLAYKAFVGENKTLYTSDGGTLRVLDVSDPANPIGSSPGSAGVAVKV